MSKPVLARLIEADSHPERPPLIPRTNRFLARSGEAHKKPSRQHAINTQLITTAAHASLNAEKPFPQIIGMLIEAGVELYHVDYLALRKTFYSCKGAVVSIPIPLEDLPQVAADFDFKAHRDKHSRQPAKRSVVARLHNAKRRWIPIRA